MLEQRDAGDERPESGSAATRRQGCDHVGWRYPNEMPSEGDVCSSCNCDYHLPTGFRAFTPSELDASRAKAEVVGLLLEWDAGTVSTARAVSELRDMVRLHPSVAGFLASTELAEDLGETP